MKKQILTAAVLLLAAALNAETIDSCFKQVSDTNPDVVKARNAMNAANAAQYKAGTSFLPRLSLGGLYTRLENAPPTVDFTKLMLPGAAAPQIAGNPLLQYRFQDNYSGYFRLTQPLFAGGRILAGFKATHDDAVAKEAVYKGSLRQARADVVRAFYGIIVAQEMAALTDEAVKQLERHLERVNNLRKQGSATEYDSLKTEAKLLSWKPKLSEAQRALKNAKRRLNIVLGNDSENDVSAEGELKGIEEKYTGTADDAVKSALANRPELIAAKQAFEASVEAKRAKAADLLPQANLQYSYNYLARNQAPAIADNDWDKWWDLKVMVNWDFFTFGGNAAGVIEADSKKEQLAETARDLEQKIKAETLDAYDGLSQAEENVAAWEKNVELSEKGHSIAETSFKTGVITNTEYLDSQLSLIEAKAQYLKAVYEYRAAYADFKRIIGMD